MQNKLPMLDQAEWEALKADLRFRQFLQYLADYREQIKDKWADGMFQHANPSEYVLSDSDAIARCQTYQDLIDLQYSTIEEFYLSQAEPEPEEDNDEDKENGDIDPDY